MSVRCLITDGKNYELNKLFVEDMMKYFPDYRFDIMKATISGWQSSQLKESEDRLPTIEELIDYLLNSAKKERNDRLAIIANKANDILANDFNKEYQEILAKAPRDSEGRLLAPNGKPSNLTERQYAQVRTKAFKDWFGDWENNPNSASKVVDENGEPLVVYHGNTDTNITKFTKGKGRYLKDGNYYFSPSKSVAESYATNGLSEEIDINDYLVIGYNVDANSEEAKYADFNSAEDFFNASLGGKVYSVFLNIKNPLLSDTITPKIEKPYDGAITIPVKDTQGTLRGEKVSQYIAIDSSQIKSATDNTGAFSSDNDDIYDSQILQQPESVPKTLNIYAGTNENADLSNFAERPLNFGNVTAYSLPEGAKSGAFKSKYSIYGIGNVSYSTKENPSYGESFSFDGLSDIFKGLRFKTVEGAFQAAKLAFTHPKGNGAKGNKYWQPKQYILKENSIDGVYYNTADVLVLTDEGKQLLLKLQNANGTLARSLGRQIVGLDIAAWDANSSKVMKAMIGRSFEDNPQALQRLLATGNAILTHTLDKGKWGTEFPRLLMEVREELRGELKEEQPKLSQELRKTYKGMITSLQDNQIFVFGSNTQGKHGAGAALTAKQKFGAKYYLAEGLLGLSYAIITKDLTKDDKKNPSRTKELIIELIHKLYEFARLNPNKEFLVAYSSTGKNLNYYSNEEMASMFASELIPNNIVFEEGFNELVNQQLQTSQEREKVIQEEQVTPITTLQLNSTQELDVEKAKATRDFLNPVIRRLTVLKLGRMFSNIVSREYDNTKLALDNRIANETDNKVKLELIFQRRKLSRFEVIKTLRPTAIFNRLKNTFLQYVNLTEDLGITLEKQLLNKNSAFRKMSDTVKTNIAKARFIKKKKLYQTILDNFKVLAVEASKGFALTEGVSLIFNEDSVVLTLEQDTYNEEGQSDISDNKEEKTKEGWMIDVRTVSSFNSLTNRIRQTINNIARVNKNGVQEIDDTGDTIYLSGSYVHSELIKELAPVITGPNDIIPILLKLAVKKPWVNQIINKLQDDPLLFTEMYRAYNKSTLNYWILKPRVLKDGSIKTLTISINKMEGMDELFETWRDNYEYGNKLDNDAIYNSNGEIIKDNVKKGLDLINEVRQAIYYVRQDTRETRIATILNKDNIRKITKTFKMLGINLEEETVAEAIEYNIGDTRYEPDFNANTLVNALFTIYDDILKNKDIKEGELADLANLYGRALENVAKVISFVTESTMESQVRHNKKSLYAHVNSGYMINLIKKLKNPEKFKAFIEKEYMSVDWFYDRKNNQWRNQLIKNLYSNQEDRDKLSHIVMLDYNGKEYKDWSTLDSTLVLFNQFRSLPTKDDHGWAYYNIPVLSDTESAEFLRMRRYIKDFRNIINKKLVNLVLQEIDRIDLVKRRSQDPNVEKIANFDMVKTVDKNSVEHIKKGGAEFKFLPELNFLEFNGKSFLDTYYDNTSKMTSDLLNEWIAKQVDNILASRFKKALTKWELIGLFDRVDDDPNGRFKYFETNSRDTAVALLGEWYWNSTFAQSQIIELLTTDLAYYKTKGNDFLTDFIKRAKEFHAPIERLNTEAEWIVNGERKKVCYDDNGNLMKNRVLYLKDCEVPSLTIDDLKEALDKNPKLTQAEKNIIIGAYKSINMADAQAYRTLDSFRRTLIMAGMWSDEEETSYNNIKNGNFRLEDITTLWNTRKPYLYTQTNQNNQVDEGNIRIPTLHKNSEMVMLTLAVLGTIMSTGKLAALERFMTKNNIDAVMFESAVKAGGLDIINLNNIEVSEVENYLADYINNNSLAIHEFDYEDYGIQTATPEHGIDAMLLVGTQIRRIIASNQDMTDPNFRFKYGNKEWTVLEWQDAYNMVNTANIKESFMNLDKKFSDIKEIEKLLLSEVRSNPRYDSDIELALTLNDNGVFNIPLLDPSITYKILSLLTSIVKNRITKLKIAGGAFIQTSAWGFKREPKVIYNKDGSVKHIECYLPCPSEELYNMLIDEGTGEVDINKKYKGADGKEHYIVPEKYREFIGYRVPTESFYSCAPFKVIGFLPRQVGTIIVVPRDIVSMAGSDYDKP